MVVVAWASLLTCSVAMAQRTVIATGEVVANDVYVRSGPSLNHYTICKLGAGFRVSVFSERGDWYEILPPEGTFSLVSGEYVDTADNKDGVINGNNVRVRAGSSLNENKYTVQAMLSKGAEVKILGENPDGFLKIEPPADATLWISRNYIEVVPDGRLALENQRRQREGDNFAMNEEPAGDGGAASGDEASPAEDLTPATQPRTRDRAANEENADAATRTPTVTTEAATTDAGESPVKTVPPADTVVNRASSSPQIDRASTLERIDEALQRELAKPVADRDLKPIQADYDEVASSTTDEVTRKYATARSQQLEHAITVADALHRLRDLDRDTNAKRRKYLEQRTQIPRVTEIPVTPFDVRGELRKSALYEEETGPRRFRIVEVNKQAPRTIAYIEFPVDSTIEISKYLGQVVGVRASAKRPLPGGVDAIPVYIADELTVIDASGGPMATGS
ncbi:MAG: SH3 domain-containing protein [Planctomycetota bacterium]|jgi:uncharacterized protein YgiM (DUF1202 family)